MTTPVPPTVPAAASAPVKQKNPVGLAALIVGIAALVVAIIPVLSFIAWLPAIAAIVLGIIGLVLKNRVRLTSWLGLALGVVAWAVAIIVSVASLAGVAGAISDSVASASPAPVAPGGEENDEASEAPAPVEGGNLVYEITTDGATITNIAYATADSTGSSTQQVADVPAPWSTELQIDGDGLFNMSVFSLVGQAADSATTISCKITYNGEVISEQTSTGAYAVVTCSGSTE